jgi:phosphate transport system substrate-binding protein
MKKFLSTLLLCTLTSGLQAERLVIKGSDTIGAKLAPVLVEEYKVKHPEINFEIAAEGSATGIAAVIESTAQIGMSSRPATAAEIAGAAARGVKLQPTVIAFDGIAVVINSKSPLSNLTKKQIEHIFTGDFTDWSSIGGSSGKIAVYTRNTSSGPYKEFSVMAMNKRDYANSALKLAGNEQITNEVGTNPAGIGYVGMAYVGAPGTKAVSVDGVEPSVANVKSRKYQFARELYLFTNGSPSGEAANFINFILSQEGQKIVEKVGFVPMP